MKKICCLLCVCFLSILLCGCTDTDSFNAFVDDLPTIGIIDKKAKLIDKLTVCEHGEFPSCSTSYYYEEPNGDIYLIYLNNNQKEIEKKSIWEYDVTKYKVTGKDTSKYPVITEEEVKRIGTSYYYENSKEYRKGNIYTINTTAKEHYVIRQTKKEHIIKTWYEYTYETK